MGSLGDGVKKVLLAGIGTAAVTAEKSKEVLDKMAERGEAAVEQGKVLNQELRHNIKKTVKENVNVSVRTSSPEELDDRSRLNSSKKEFMNVKQQFQKKKQKK